MAWDWEFAFKVFPRVLSAFAVTIEATLSAFLLALIVGLLLALARRSSVKWLSRPVAAFVEFVRSTPLLVQLYFLFYVLPRYGLSLSAFQAGVLGLGLHYSTYLSEVYRAGIDAVPHGQWEAGTALNFSRLRTWTRLILPQAVPPVVPVLGNYLIDMFKMSPLLSAITVVEMLATARIVGTHYFKYLEPITMVGALFLAISYPAAILVRRAERHLRLESR